MTTLNLPAGVTSFQANHTFKDDPPSGTSSDTVAVSIVVTNTSSGAFGTGSAAVKINNTPPTIQILTQPTTIAENNTFTLTGIYHDSGTLDTHTLVINWGSNEGTTTITTLGPNPSGTTLFPVGSGNWQFTASHQYLDDNPTATSSDIYSVSANVTDDDGGSASGGTTVTIKNLPPVINALSGSPGSQIKENDLYTLTGTFHDASTTDTQTIVVRWGGGTTSQPDEGTITLTTAGPNPTGTSLVSLGGGDWRFTATHRYLDDNPTASSSDGYFIQVSITDDDGGTATGSASISVVNTLPRLSLLGPVRPLRDFATPNPNQNVLLGMCIVADDQYTAVGSATNTLIYDTKTGNLLRTIPVIGFRSAIYGSTLAIHAHGKVQLFDAATGSLLRIFENPLGVNTNDFGSSVAIRGNTLAIGASADSTGAKSAGVVYLYDVVTGNLLRTIYNPFPSELSYFGSSVAIQGNTIAIGAPGQIVNDRLWGAAYLYDVATGSLLQTFASQAIGSQFGHSVTLSGNTVVVGAWLHGGAMEFAGSAFAFDAVTGKMLYELKNSVSQAYDSFGWSVAVSDSIVVVGAYIEDTVAPNTGTAYIYDTATGNLLATLTDPNPSADSQFGYSLAIANGEIFIGEPLKYVSASSGGTAFVTQAVPTATIEEGSTFALTGEFHDDGLVDTHTIRIDWSDGKPGQPSEGSTVITTAGPNPIGTTLTSLGNGNWRFTATHLYSDDAPSNSAVDEYRLLVTISDDDQGSVQGSTIVVVTNVPPTPSIVSVSTPRIEGTPVTVTGAATDPAGVKDPIALSWRALKEGTTVAFASGSGPNFTFTPNNEGNYRLELTATDDDGGVATTTQMISVADQAPVASDLSFTLNEDASVSVKLQATDVPADLISYSIITSPQHGILTSEFPNLLYRPTSDFNGTDRFTYQASDGVFPSNVATVSLTVRPINDPPRFDSLLGNYSAFDENSAGRGPAGAQIIPGWAKSIAAGPADELGQTLNFVVANDAPALFAIQPAVTLSGTLAFTPKPNAHGTANVTVMLRDGGGGDNTSPSVTFQIQIIKQHALHNSAESGDRNGLDVTGAASAEPDGFIVAADVLAVVNYINAHGSGRILAGAGFGPPYPDVDGDDQVVPQDVIDIINYINSHQTEAEATNPVEVAPVAASSTTETPVSLLQSPQQQSTSISSDLMNLLAADTAATQWKRRRLSF